jgi:hypothetical protein
MQTFNTSVITVAYIVHNWIKKNASTNLPVKQLIKPVADFCEFLDETGYPAPYEH